MVYQIDAQQPQQTKEATASRISLYDRHTPTAEPPLTYLGAAAASFFLSITNLSKSALPRRSHISAMCCEHSEGGQSRNQWLASFSARI